MSGSLLSKYDSALCSAVRAMAEREFASFRAAVTRLFGPDQAERSAHDWLRALQSADHVPTTLADWRRITITASQRLAERLELSAAAR